MLEPDDAGPEYEIPEFNVSYKPQKISPKSEMSVRQMLHKKIRESYLHPQFVSDVMKPMQIEVRTARWKVANRTGVWFARGDTEWPLEQTTTPVASV
jgi:translation initiation factor RLI1